MRRMSKSELATLAGVCYATFSKWLNDQKTREKMRQEIGIAPDKNKRLLPPKVVTWICKEYDIDLP